MRSLDSTLERLYEDLSGYCTYCYNPPATPMHCTAERYLEIPTDGQIVEVPLFAMKSFIIENSKSDGVSFPPKPIAVCLTDLGAHSYYKALNTIFRDTITSKFDSNRLFKVKLKEREPEYYIAQGVVFDAQFHPVFIMSWQLEKCFKDGDARCVYKCLRPIVRISPSCFINKGDTIQRFIVGKLLSTVLNTKVLKVRISFRGGLPDNSINCVMVEGSDDYINSCFTIKVEIDTSPFKIVEPDTPSISTDNKKLMDLVLENICEVKI